MTAAATWLGYMTTWSLCNTKIVNGIGMAVLTVPETHAIISQLADDLLLNIYFTYRPLTGGGSRTNKTL